MMCKIMATKYIYIRVCHIYICVNIYMHLAVYVVITVLAETLGNELN